MSSNTLAAETCSGTDGNALVFESGLGVGLLERPNAGREVDRPHSGRQAAASVDQWQINTSLSVFCRDLVQLTKPRIMTMILVTTVSTAMIAAGGAVPVGSLLLLLFATGLVAGSAGGANQIWERVIDR